MPKKHSLSKRIKRFKVESSIEVVDTIHGQVTTGMVGVITSILPDGYAVLFKNTIHRSSFGGGIERRPAIVFMKHADLKPLTIKTVLDYLPKDRQSVKRKELITAMSKADLSLTRAATIVFGTTGPYDLARVETTLNSLWDEGVCVNRGQFEDYKYRITDKGVHLVEKNLL